MRNLAGNGFDASNEDGPGGAEMAGNIQLHPGVRGLYLPDAIASFRVNGQPYLVTANEGDSRDAGDDRAYTDEVRVKDPDLDGSPLLAADPNLQDDDQLGRLEVLGTNRDQEITGDDPLGLNSIVDIDGDGEADNLDGDGNVDTLFSFGARSTGIWDENGDLVSDTGDALERIIVDVFPDNYDDDRSDDKGPEPEGVDVFMVDGRPVIIVGTERFSISLAFDASDPTNPQFVGALEHDGDISPERILAVMASDGALLDDVSGEAMDIVLVTNEVSGTATHYSVAPIPVPAAARFLLGGLGVLVRFSRRR